MYIYIPYDQWGASQLELRIEFPNSAEIICFGWWQREGYVGTRMIIHGMGPQATYIWQGDDLGLHRFRRILLHAILELCYRAQ
jgi:hypothetical protein